MSRIPTSYRTTTVNWGKSQADIMKLLMRHGVQDVRFTALQSRGEVYCEFNYPTTLDGKEVIVGVRVKVPIPPKGRLKDDERAKNQAHRALLYYLKAKFEALQFGLVEFIEEFLPHVTLMDKSGRSATVYQLLERQVKNGFITGQQTGVLQLPMLSKEDGDAGSR